MKMDNLHPLTASWDELAELALKALKKNDLEALRHLDGALHYRFLSQFRRGDETSRGEFLRGLLNIIDCPEARQRERPGPIERLLAHWEHLCELADALLKDVDTVERAARIVASRKHARELLELVAQQSEGLPAGALADRLKIKKPHLTKLLNDLEELDVIERAPSGRHVFVRLGQVGQSLREREVSSASPASEPESGYEGLFPDGPMLKPLVSPVQYLTIQ
jgi:DNA-binding MarR family transcriptional regulator